MLAVPPIVEDALRRAAAAILGDAAVTGPDLTRAVVDRSRRYTTERDRLALPLDADADLAARACFFTVADCSKPLLGLAELASAGVFPDRDPLRVVDLGAGCGAMSLGLLLAVSGSPAPPAVELALLDHDDRALAIAERAIAEVAAAVGVRVATRVLVRELARVTITGCDLVLIGSVLNELPDDAAVDVAAGALAAIDDAGAVVIVEPALRDSARALHAVRDRLIDGGAHMFAPCGHDTVPCPMLAHDRDWCHEERPVTLPPRTRQLAQVTGLRDGALKFSYLVMRRRPGGVAPGALRVVDQPRSQKGKHELRVCGERGYGTIRLLARHRSDTNRALERARRGDLVELAPPLAAAGGDVTAEHRVTVRRIPVG